MIELSVSEVSIEFEVGRRVLDKLSFQVDSGQRVGLLGKNGAGKTTLFRILTGELTPDEGAVHFAAGRRVGMISQIPAFPAGHTVAQVLDSAFDRLRGAEAELRDLAVRMGETPDRDLMQRYDALLALLEREGGYSTETELNKVCNGLQIPPDMRARAFDELSGGERTRVNLARLILENTDILLLDEPTNHLDIRACEWLEEYLAGYRGTVLCASHDRYFLDRVISRVVELADGRAEQYTGNYSAYAAEREARHLEQARRYEKEQAKAVQLQAAADKLHLWAFMGNDKLHKRAFSIEKRMERIVQTDRPKRERAMKARFGETEFRGDEVLSLRGLTKGYGGRTLFSDVNLEVRGGERIALLGENGAGKTTLLRLLTGQELPDAGAVRTGPAVRVGLLPQIVNFDHPERNLVDTMLYACNCSTQEARDRLAAFRFTGEEVFKPVSALSGGERSRLMLCVLMARNINLLVLDEPTNHLDIPSREWIEEAVEEFGGTLLFVSHDRYFVRRFAARVWEIERGAVADYPGDYESFRAEKARQAEPSSPAQTAPEKKERPVRTGGTKMLAKQLAAAERAVDEAERHMAGLEAEIEEYAADYQKLGELYAAREEAERNLAERYAAWEELAAEMEQMR